MLLVKFGLIAIVGKDFVGTRDLFNCRVLIDLVLEWRNINGYFWRERCFHQYKPMMSKSVRKSLLRIVYFDLPRVRG